MNDAAIRPLVEIRGDKMIRSDPFPAKPEHEYFPKEKGNDEYFRYPI